MEFSLELCSVGGPASLGGLLAKMGLGGVISRASAQQVAAAFVGGKVRKALEAAHAATQVVAVLQVRGLRTAWVSARVYCYWWLCMARCCQGQTWFERCWQGVWENLLHSSRALLAALPALHAVFVVLTGMVLEY